MKHYVYTNNRGGPRGQITFYFSRAHLLVVYWFYNKIFFFFLIFRYCILIDCLNGPEIATVPTTLKLTICLKTKLKWRFFSSRTLRIHDTSNDMIRLHQRRP